MSCLKISANELFRELTCVLVEIWTIIFFVCIFIGWLCPICFMLGGYLETFLSFVVFFSYIFYIFGEFLNNVVNLVSFVVDLVSLWWIWWVLWWIWWVVVNLVSCCEFGEFCGEFGEFCGKFDGIVVIYLSFVVNLVSFKNLWWILPNYDDFSRIIEF